MNGGTSYAAIWRWHFYAGLFVLPFIQMLSVTGSIYLFKPQIDRWEERAWSGLSSDGTVSPDAQLAAVLRADPGARFQYYRLPERVGDAAVVGLTHADGRMRQVFVSPQGRVVGSLDPDARITATVARIHGTLLIGEWGDWLVELAASWTIVMIVSGLYLWWPRPVRAAGTLWPRLSLKGRPLLKDLHRVTGFWIAGLVLVTLASGLPWAGAWGSAFAWARTELGLVDGPRDWKVGHAAHAPASGTTLHPSSSPSLPLATFVARAAAENMPHPVMVVPPRAGQRFGGMTGDVWTVRSDTQNRPQSRQVTYDPATGAEVARRGFADKHVIDRFVGTGIAWHEGQLFGVVNQVIGVLTALGLVAVSLLGLLMWVRRRPQGRAGAPPPSGPLPRGLIALLVAAGALLPLFGASALLLALVDWLRGIWRRRTTG